MDNFITDLVYCGTCKEYTNQIIIKYYFIPRKNFVFNDTHVQKFKCNVCQRTNERKLYYCNWCHKYTSQRIANEEESWLFADHIDMKLLCNSCGNENEITKYTKEYLQRLENAKDEEGGIYCHHCLCYKKQTLIDKQLSELNPDYYLTTYRCKICGAKNYGQLEKKDVI